MKKVAILALLLLVACGGIGQGDSTPKLEDVQVGTKGLDVTLDASETSILMCQQANIQATFKNLGTKDIENGQYNIIYDSAALTPLSPTTGRLNIRGKTPFYPQGGLEKTAFAFQSRELPGQIRSHTSPFIFTACYPYETRADFDVCVDPDILKTQLTKPCKAEDISTGGGQGAPVAISKIETKMFPQGVKVQPTFIIHISNVGGGTIVQQDKLDLACTGQGEGGLRGIIQAQVTLGNEELDCNRETLDISSSDPKIICKSRRLFDQGGLTFESVLKVKLNYGYVHRKSFSFTVRRLEGQTSCLPASATNPGGTRPYYGDARDEIIRGG